MHLHCTSSFRMGAKNNKSSSAWNTFSIVGSVIQPLLHKNDNVANSSFSIAGEENFAKTMRLETTGNSKFPPYIILWRSNVDRRILHELDRDKRSVLSQIHMHEVQHLICAHCIKSYPVPKQRRFTNKFADSVKIILAEMLVVVNA